jgi:hypothetical protein
MSVKLIRSIQIITFCSESPFYLRNFLYFVESPDGSFGIATGWTAGVRFSVRERDFFVLHSVQADSEAHPASYPVDTGGSFPGDKAAGA